MLTIDQAINERAAVSIKEYSSLTGLSKSSILRGIKSRKIPSLKLSGRTLIPCSHIKELFEGKTDDK